MFIRLAMLGLLGFLTASCASMMTGPTQVITFQSSPEDVVVTINRRVAVPVDWTKQTQGYRAQPAITETEWTFESRALGKTPLILPMDREEHQTVTFSKEGYKPVTMNLSTTLNPWFWGNLAFGGAFGSTTDGMTGSMYEYSPSQYLVTLNPALSTSIDSGMLSSQRDKATVFIVRRYANLMADLSIGSGEDMRALFQILGVDATHEPDARRKVKALSEVYPDAGNFAIHVTDLYLKPPVPMKP